MSDRYGSPLTFPVSLVHDGHVTGLLDWEEADLDWLVWDLASSILPFCSTAGGDLDTSATQGFLDTYRAVGFSRRRTTSSFRC
jgi:Phosphotransferase enzyme family